MRRLALGILALVLLLPAPVVADTVDPAPIRSFSTAFGGYGVAREPRTGLLYATDGAGTVHVFAPTASGASPVEAFSFAEPPACGGAHTAPTFDSSGQNLAINCSGNVGFYSVASNGSVSYRGSVNTGLAGDASSVFDSAGKLIVAGTGDSTFVALVDVNNLAAGASPFAITGLDHPLGMALSGGTLYIANSGSSANVLAVPYPGGNHAARTITAPVGVSELRSVQVDGAGHLYVGAFTGGVLVYAANATGAAAPLKRLDGAASGLGSGGITSIALDGSRRLYVSQLTGGGRFATFAPLIPIPAVPGRVSGLHVTGKKTARKRVVRWTPGPAGTAPITSYRVVVTRRAKVVLRKTTPGTSLTIRVRKQLKKSGRYTVAVTARNAVGSGSPVSVRFRVRIG